MSNPFVVLCELVADVEAAGVEATTQDWPDLEVTYRHAQEALRDWKKVSAALEIVLDLAAQNVILDSEMDREAARQRQAIALVERTLTPKGASR